MGDVIEVKFGRDRSLDALTAQVLKGLLDLAEFTGDDRALLAKKAEIVTQLFTSLLEYDMKIEVGPATIPGPITAAQAQAIDAAMRQACVAGVKATIDRDVRLLADHVNWLCTSVLSLR